MSTSHQPAASDERIEQYDLFALDCAPAPPEALLPALATAPPKAPARTRGKATAASPRPTVPPPTRLDIAPIPETPAIPPLQLAAARLALCQALAAQAHAAHQALIAQTPGDMEGLANPPTTERAVAAARLFAEAPTHNAAVCLLALEAPQE